MPVNVDTVYQTVQALANKEQRGYLTPQEFNLFANQAQADIFEQYFYDLNAFRKQGEQTREVGDSISYIQQKITNTSGVTVTNSSPCTHNGNGVWSLPSGKLTGRIFLERNSDNTRRELYPLPGHVEELLDLRASRWHKIGSDEVFYFEDGWGRFQVHNAFGPVTGVTHTLACEEIKGKPNLVYWGYVVVNEVPVYDSISSANFALDSSEQTDLVMIILKLAGISIEDQALAQAAAGEEQQNIQQENK